MRIYKEIIGTAIQVDIDDAGFRRIYDRLLFKQEELDLAKVQNEKAYQLTQRARKTAEVLQTYKPSGYDDAARQVHELLLQKSEREDGVVYIHEVITGKGHDGTTEDVETAHIANAMGATNAGAYYWIFEWDKLNEPERMNYIRRYVDIEMNKYNVLPRSNTNWLMDSTQIYKNDSFDNCIWRYSN